MVVEKIGNAIVDAVVAEVEPVVEPKTGMVVLFGAREAKLEPVVLEVEELPKIGWLLVVPKIDAVVD